MCINQMMLERMVLQFLRTRCWEQAIIVMMLSSNNQQESSSSITWFEVAVEVAIVRIKYLMISIVMDISYRLQLLQCETVTTTFLRILVFQEIPQ
ncbi:hypothetical protein L195_g058591, partial [Trifolium pratense]